ncbi:MAG: hypothetical protein ABI954_05745, partial [Pyrinomonadaceae bacterium]
MTLTKCTLLQAVAGILFVVCFVSIINAFGAGEVDPTFNINVERTSMLAYPNSLTLQPDGKILVSGNFNRVNSVRRSGIARFNSDSTLDTSFSTGEIINQYGSAGTVNVMTVQPDGKILIGGFFTSIGGLPRIALTRLNQDGSLDTSFVLTNSTGINGTVNALAVQSDGKIVVGGTFAIFDQPPGGGNATMHANLIRLNADGSFDFSFNLNPPNTVNDIIIQPDGKILIAGYFDSVFRLNQNGSIDSAFAGLSGNGSVNKIALQPDGKIVAVGNFTIYGGFTQGHITRLNSDGSLDTTFNINGLGANSTIYDVELASDGKIIIGGAFSSYNGIQRTRVARLNTDGSLDLSLNYTGVLPFNSYATNIAVQMDGKIIILVPSSNPVTLFRLNTDGSVDANFTVNFAFVSPAVVNDLQVQPDGKILVGGSFTQVNGILQNWIFRLNTDGTRDTGFTSGIGLGTGFGGVNAIALQSDGKIIAGGELPPDLNRLNQDGSRDTSFTPPISTSSIIYSLAVQPDDKILVGGNIILFDSSTPNLVRLNSDGSLDTSFNTTAGDQVRGILLQPDGKIVIVGAFTQVNGIVRGRAARLNSDGSVDNTFNPPFGANFQIFKAVLQPDGKIIIGGMFTAVNGVNRSFLARLNYDGLLDTTYTPTIDSSVTAILQQPDGKTLIGGVFTTVNGQTRNHYARLNADGSLDPSLTSNVGADNTVWDFALQQDGRILIGGAFTKVGGADHIGLARLLNTSTPRGVLYDFDGDARADISVFRPSS